MGVCVSVLEGTQAQQPSSDAVFNTHAHSRPPRTLSKCSTRHCKHCRLLPLLHSPASDSADTASSACPPATPRANAKRCKAGAPAGRSASSWLQSPLACSTSKVVSRGPCSRLAGKSCTVKIRGVVHFCRSKRRPPFTCSRRRAIAPASAALHWSPTAAGAAPAPYGPITTPPHHGRWPRAAAGRAAEPRPIGLPRGARGRRSAVLCSRSRVGGWEEATALQRGN